MKTINFNKQILATMAIAFLCCFSAKAQDTKEWSIIPYTKIGYVLDGSVRLLDEVYHANAGVDAKVSFNEHWSLLAGVEYNYRWGFSVERATNTRYDANETINFGIGPEVELGGRIRLSEKDRLRIGMQSQLCANHVTEKGQSSFYGGFFGTFLAMGYEHRF